MTNVQSNSNEEMTKSKFDLAERTAKFSEAIIDFAKSLPENTITRPLISQLIRAATSIGANYMEADEANSRKDFINKMVISKKEIKETRYWLRLIAHTVPEKKDEARVLWQEAQELNLIFASIVRKTQDK